MQFRVVAPTCVDPSTPPDQLVLPANTPHGLETHTRQVSINEMMSMVPGFDSPAEAVLGGTMLKEEREIEGHQQVWSDRITEKPALGTTEVWEKPWLSSTRAGVDL